MAKQYAVPTDPLVPSKTPFGYNVGVNYESWEDGRVGYSIPNDLDQIFQNFRLIRTYHDAAVGTGNPTVPTIDATQASVIGWTVAHPSTELVMGTNNNALAQGGFGSPWSAGLMTSKAYTDLWVKMIIKAFGSVENVRAGLKAVLLGNELDQNGPPPDNASFNDYVNTWIPTSFDNLKASMAAAGLGSIPISTTIANYGASNTVSVKVPAYISSHWSSAWNNGEPFVMFNQYTGDGQQSTDFVPVEQYFDSVAKALGSKLEVFVGETGYSTYWGADKQATVYKEIFSWLTEQRHDGGKTVPLFAFDAFDRPSVTPADQVQFGIYDENGSFQPSGLKADLAGVIPGWTTKPIGAPSPHDDTLYGSHARERIEAHKGDDIVLGLGGDDRLLGQGGDDLLIGHKGRDVLRGGGGNDFLDGDGGKDVIFGGGGNDTLAGGRGGDTFVFAHAPQPANVDTIIDFHPGEDRIELAKTIFPALGLTLSSGELHVGSKAGDRNDHLIYDPKTGALFYDGDGEGGKGQVQFAQLDPHLHITKGDFLLE